MATTSPIFGLPAPELTDAANIEDAVTPLRDRIEVVLNALIPVGFIIADAGSAIPTLEGWEWDWADGDLIDRTTYAAFFARVGHAYNGNVDPGANKVRKPDRRGRVGLTADSMGPLGAASRLTVAAGHSNARGQSGGEERHTQLLTELAAHYHEHIGETGQTHPNEVGSDGDRFQVGWGGANRQTTGTRSLTQGGGQPFNIVQPYQVDNALVRIA
jgi:microcystin-dependent protein